MICQYHGYQCYHMGIICMRKNKLWKSWMLMLSHENHIRGIKLWYVSIMDVDVITWENICIRRIKLWEVMDVDVIMQESCKKNQTMICQYHGCQFYHMRIIFIQRIKLWKVMDVDVITWESYAYKESNFEKSWMLMLSHENHIRRIKVWYVSIMDVDIITWETHMKNQTIIRHCHVVIIACAIWLM